MSLTSPKTQHGQPRTLVQPELSLATFMGIERPDVWEEGCRAVQEKGSEMHEESDGVSRPLFQ